MSIYCLRTTSKLIIKDDHAVQYCANKPITITWERESLTCRIWYHVKGNLNTYRETRALSLLLFTSTLRWWNSISISNKPLHMLPVFVICRFATYPFTFTFIVWVHENQNLQISTLWNLRLQKLTFLSNNIIGDPVPNVIYRLCDRKPDLSFSGISK